MHPNQRGHEVIFENLYEAIQQDPRIHCESTRNSGRTGKTPGGRKPIMDKIKQQVRQFLSEILPDGKMASIGDDTPLRSSGGVLDRRLLRLVSIVEEKFGIEVAAYDAGIENFDRIEDIAAFVQRKHAARP